MGLFLLLFLALCLVGACCGMALSASPREDEGESTDELMAFVRKCCDSAINIGKDSYGLELDYSPETIPRVNDILNGYHDIYLAGTDKAFTEEYVEAFASIFGIYVGEVIRRHYGMDFAWEQTPNGIGLVRGKDAIFPVNKAGKQIRNGLEDGDEIQSFFDTAIVLFQKKLPNS